MIEGLSPLLFLLQIRRISALERAAAGATIRLQSGGADSESSFKVSFKRETKVLKTLSVIMGVFVCCWMPFFVLNCMIPFCEAEPAGAAACISSTTFDVFVWFGWANSSINPVIYAFNADFRRAFSTLLGCQRLCQGSAPPDPDPPTQYRPGTLLPQESHRGHTEEPLQRRDGCAVVEELGANGALEKLWPAPSGTLEEGEGGTMLKQVQPITVNGRHAALP